MGSEDGYNSNNNNGGKEDTLVVGGSGRILWPRTRNPCGNSNSNRYRRRSKTNGREQQNGPKDRNHGASCNNRRELTIDTNGRHGDEDPENITFSRACVHPPVPSVSLTRKVSIEIRVSFPSLQLISLHSTSTP